MKILMPVDGTNLSIHETKFAIGLVKQGLSAKFVLVNVQEPASFYEMLIAQDLEQISEAASEAAQDLMQPCVELLKEAGIPYETVMATGDPAQSMLELIETHSCSMVIMGSRALGAVRSWLEGGSTSQRLVHMSPVPVLLVTPPKDEDAE